MYYLYLIIIIVLVGLYVAQIGIVTYLLMIGVFDSKKEFKEALLPYPILIVNIISEQYKKLK